MHYKNSEPRAIAATPDQVREILRRQGGGGNGHNDPEPPTFKRLIDSLTLPFRNAAKVALRKEISDLSQELAQETDPVACAEIEDVRLSSLNAQFDRIVRGGVSGAVMAYMVLRQTKRGPAPMA